ncbi:MAG: DUF4114 domain-containing protein [Deltaproteobacteria bacterium]|nr:DUF4114 domain-containing protein [Deltaproteobacteria bacterium]
MFKNAFGWYNVTGKKPEFSDLHVLIDCNTADGARTEFDLLAQAEYTGGEIGFFLVTPQLRDSQPPTCAGGDCCATVARVQAKEGYVYYSEPQYNPDTDYVHLLIYNSKINSHLFFFGWEDTFEGTTTDYSDFVTSVSGISCAGAGERCDTGKLGVCSIGVTNCDIEGNLICQSGMGSTSERCDGLDNDCNGKVDDNATCEGEKQCYQGACVDKCTASLEFPCQSGFACDEATELCVEKSCKDKVCAEGEVCRSGECGTGCEGVTCPPKQECMGGLCVDLCAGSNCGDGEVCLLGVCVPDCVGCGGLTCTGAFSCNTTTGACYDASCEPSCGADTYCKEGACVDFCHGVSCPGGMTCVDGHCPPPGIGLAPSDYGAVDFQTPWPRDGGADAQAVGDGPIGFKGDDGCGCGLSGSPNHGLAVALLTLFLLGLFSRRRRRS